MIGTIERWCLVWTCDGDINHYDPIINHVFFSTIPIVEYRNTSLILQFRLHWFNYNPYYNGIHGSITIRVEYNPYTIISTADAYTVDGKSPAPPAKNGLSRDL